MVTNLKPKAKTQNNFMHFDFMIFIIFFTTQLTKHNSIHMDALYDNNNNNTEFFKVHKYQNLIFYFCGKGK